MCYKIYLSEKFDDSIIEFLAFFNKDRKENENYNLNWRDKTLIQVENNIATMFKKKLELSC